MTRAPAGVIAAALVLALSLSLAACGKSDAPSGAPGTESALPVPINLANCEDWNDGAVEERFGTIRALRAFVGTQVAGTEATGTTLDDDRAYDLFENYCENEFARGFRLYKLYSRAAPFAAQGAAEEDSRTQP